MRRSPGRGARPRLRCCCAGWAMPVSSSHTEPGPRSPGDGDGSTRVDIERPFGMMIEPFKERPVTRHDAERKRKIMDVIAATIRARGYPPSVREIAKAVGLASTSAVHHHLQILEKEGYLERGAAQSRAIRLTPTAAIRLGLSSELVPQSTASESRVLPII